MSDKPEQPPPEEELVSEYKQLSFFDRERLLHGRWSEPGQELPDFSTKSPDYPSISDDDLPDYTKRLIAAIEQADRGHLTAILLNAKALMYDGYLSKILSPKARLINDLRDAGEIDLLEQVIAGEFDGDVHSAEKIIMKFIRQEQDESKARRKQARLNRTIKRDLSRKP